MSLSKIILLLLLVFPDATLFSQEVQRDPVTHQVTNLNEALRPQGSGRYDLDNSALNGKKDSISYDNIDGSPFWNPISQSAFLYSNSTYITTLPVRINLVTGEAHFLKDSTELVLDNHLINKIVFKTANDSSVFISQVPNLLLNKEKIDGFVQVLNVGKYQLLKYSKRKISTTEFKSQSQTQTINSYYFTDNDHYFIMHNNMVENIKKLNRDNLLIYLPSSSNLEPWVKENNINYKNEEDVVRFLNYYNSRFNN